MVANAGGVNPAGLAKMLRSKIAASGLDLKVASIAGDDLIERGVAHPPDGLTSVNAYLGA